MSATTVTLPTSTMTISKAVLWGGLIAGVLDAVDGVVAFGFKGLNPIQVLQYIASGLLGPSSFHGGLVTAADLAAYSAKARTPIHGVYRGFDVYGPPPPSSGGIVLVEMLNILENFDLKKQGRFSTAAWANVRTFRMRSGLC